MCQKNCGSSILLEDIAHKYSKGLHLRKDLTQHGQSQIERSMKEQPLGNKRVKPKKTIKSEDKLEN